MPRLLDSYVLLPGEEADLVHDFTGELATGEAITAAASSYIYDDDRADAKAVLEKAVPTFDATPETATLHVQHAEGPHGRKVLAVVIATTDASRKLAHGWRIEIA